MLEKTEGIVLKTVRYSDSSIIAHIYTREYGWLNFIIPGVRSSRNKSRGNILQPLQQLELDIYFAPQKNLMKIKEYRPAYIYQQLHADIIKQSIALFSLELFNKCIHEHETNPELYDFLISFLTSLDIQTDSVAFSALTFMEQLSTYLGFAPSMEQDGAYFNLMEGNFSSVFNEYSLNEYETLKWKHWLGGAYEAVNTLSDRTLLLEKWLLYYRLHVPGFQPLNSLSILQQLLHT